MPSITGMLACAEFAKVNVQTRLFTVDRAAKRFLFNAHLSERGLRGKARSRYLYRSCLTPRVPIAPFPVEIAPTAGWLLGPHRIPISVRHRNFKGNQACCCWTLMSHLHAGVDSYNGSSR